MRAFLERLVMAEQMSASTQGLVLNALVFYFKHVVGTSFGDLGEFQRSKPQTALQRAVRFAAQKGRYPEACRMQYAAALLRHPPS